MTTTVTHKNNVPFFGDVPLLEYINDKSFSDVIFELLSGNKPNKSESKIFELILNISIDHGPDTPSAIETIKHAQKRESISESVASGISQINEVHGGAIEPAMEILYKIDQDNIDIKSFVQSKIESGQKIAGFGHRIYEVDPRTKLLFDTAEKEKLDTKYIKIANKISQEINSVKDRAIPVNIDGAIAAILCTFGWDSKLSKAVFIIARTPGLCGQYLNINADK